MAPYTPDIGVASSEPLSGKFKIACGDENSHITDPISYNASALEIQDALFYECPELENMVEVYDSKYYRYPENGR